MRLYRAGYLGTTPLAEVPQPVGHMQESQVAAQVCQRSLAPCSPHSRS